MKLKITNEQVNDAVARLEAGLLNSEAVEDGTEYDQAWALLTVVRAKPMAPTLTESKRRIGVVEKGAAIMSQANPDFNFRGRRGTSPVDAVAVFNGTRNAIAVSSYNADVAEVLSGIGISVAA